METLSDQLILFFGSTLVLFFWRPASSLIHILALLAAIIFLCLCSYCNLECQRLWQLPAPCRLLLTGMWISLAGLSLAHPAFGCFLPLLFYGLAVSLRHVGVLALIPLPFLSSGMGICWQNGKASGTGAGIAAAAGLLHGIPTAPPAEKQKFN